jgi:uncharacterized protein YjiS (DUF1127 family)
MEGFPMAYAVSRKNAVVAFFEQVFATFARAVDTQVASRRSAIAALEAKTDVELDALGIKRRDIPAFVHRDLYFS